MRWMRKAHICVVPVRCPRFAIADFQDATNIFCPELPEADIMGRMNTETQFTNTLKRN
jgi:hypothetical protein